MWLLFCFLFCLFVDVLNVMWWSWVFEVGFYIWQGRGVVFRSIGKIKNLKKNVDVGMGFIHILSLSNKKRQTTGGFLVSPR